MTILKRVCLFLLSAAAAMCADQGSISGMVLTAAGKGAAVSNAPVEARNVETKETYKATTASDGSYKFSGLPAGAYELSVEKMFPFLPFQQSDVRVEAGRATRMDIRLDDINLNTLGDGGEQFAEAMADKPVVSVPAPRTSDGQPDLSGVWQPTSPKLAGDEPKPLPDAEAASKQRGKRGRVTDLQTNACLPGGISLSFFFDYRIVQTPSLIVIVDGGFSPPRQIYLDGRGHPKEFNPSWMGHSIGHWEGDTLVVETAGFNDLGWIPSFSNRWPAGFPATEKLSITERFRRLDLGRLEVETTYDDPSEFKTPFTTREVRSLAPKDEEVLEYVCAENERDVSHMRFEQ
jgi:Carboxypeptidase regulatory-like domain